MTMGSLLFKQWAKDYPDGLRHRAFASNPVHLRYLEALGCKLEAPEPYGPLGALFREFSFV